MKVVTLVSSVWRIPSRFTFTCFWILTISIAAPIRTIRYITSSSFPSIITLAEIWSYSNTMKTRWITNALRTINSFPPIEAIALSRAYTFSIHTIIAYTQIALIARPTCDTIASVITHTFSMDTSRKDLFISISIANCIVTTYTSPSVIALAALPSHYFIILKTF